MLMIAAGHLHQLQLVPTIKLPSLYAFRASSSDKERFFSDRDLGVVLVLYSTQPMV